MNSINLKKLIILLVCIFISGCQTNQKVGTSIKIDPSNVPTPGPSFIRPSDPIMDFDDSVVSVDSMSPEQMIDYHSIEYLPVSLEECIRQALETSDVFRDLSGTIVSSPTAVGTTFDPAIRYTDPTFGEEAALSAFDANVVSSVFFENNDRPFNNLFSGNSDGLLKQDLGELNLEVNKLAATGTLFTSRSTINYDANNQAGNRFAHSWESIFESGFRHPLLQGSGSLFNRIAGPSQIPGSYNGVLIARTNTEISLAEFVSEVQRLVSNVENAYWDLYYAYRELDAQVAARDAALIVFERTEAQSAEQRISKLATASAHEQYLRFETAIIESLEGRPIEGTQANSGTSGGSFRRNVGVRVAERRLRYLIGMEITDGKLVKPSETPALAPVVFDWNQTVSNAISRRPDLRGQRWRLKQKQLEYTASKNFLMPRLDLVGNYRFRGLGRSLTGGSTTLQDDIDNPALMALEGNSNAFADLASGNFQELQIGAELRMPVGYRRANAAVRSAELELHRERAILKEQERKVLLDLSNAVAETRRSHSALKIAEQRFDAAKEYRSQAAEAIDRGRAQFDVLLEAQRRVLEAQLQFINAEVEYAIAVKNVHYEKGTFLDYHGIGISESQSDPQAYIDVEVRNSARQQEFNYVYRDDPIGVPAIINAQQEIPIIQQEVPIIQQEVPILSPGDQVPIMQASPDEIPVLRSDGTQVPVIRPADEPAFPMALPPLPRENVGEFNGPLDAVSSRAENN